MKYFEFYDTLYSIKENLFVTADCSNKFFRQTSEEVDIIDMFIDKNVIHFYIECDGDVLFDTDLCMETKGMFCIPYTKINSIDINQHTIKSFGGIISNNTIDIGLVSLDDVMSLSIDDNIDVEKEIQITKETIACLVNDLTFLSNKLYKNFTEKELMIINKNHVNYYGYDDLVTIPTQSKNLFGTDCDIIYNKIKVQKSYLRSLKTIKTIKTNQK